MKSLIEMEGWWERCLGLMATFGCPVDSVATGALLVYKVQQVASDGVLPKRRAEFTYIEGQKGLPLCGEALRALQVKSYQSYRSTYLGT